jgi:predicted anti-sigma-YlaC factor YlaD
MMAERARAECPDEETFARLLGSSIRLEGLDALLDHLDTCEACRELAVTLARRSVTEFVKQTTR